MTFLRAMLTAATLCVWAVGLGPGSATAQTETAGRCPPGYTIQVDKVGQEDRCYTTMDVSCGPNAAIKTDSMGYADLCAPSTAMPCPDGFSQIYRQGRDGCEYSKPPACPAGRKLQVQAGADVCR
jgi:hypothetical protein